MSLADIISLQGKNLISWVRKTSFSDRADHRRYRRFYSEIHFESGV